MSSPLQRAWENDPQKEPLIEAANAMAHLHMNPPKADPTPMYCVFELRLWVKGTPLEIEARIQEMLKKEFAYTIGEGGDFAVMLKEHAGPCSPPDCRLSPKSQSHKVTSMEGDDWVLAIEEEIASKPRLPFLKRLWWAIKP